jgi:hypothetical protein
LQGGEYLHYQAMAAAQGHQDAPPVGIVSSPQDKLSSFKSI